MQMVDSEDEQLEDDETAWRCSLFINGLESIISHVFMSNVIQSSPNPIAAYLDYLRKMSNLFKWPKQY